MFLYSAEDRLSAWAKHRTDIDNSEYPLDEVCNFWNAAPYIPYNKNIDPYNSNNWPTPWEILIENKYDDFTKALMMAWSLKLTKRYQQSTIEIKTLVNSQKTCYYNIVCVDDKWALNYKDTGPVLVADLPNSFYLENLIEIRPPR
jgi:hypothetical protein